jgi:hypothetical protein
MGVVFNDDEIIHNMGMRNASEKSAIITVFSMRDAVLVLFIPYS